MDEMAAHGSWLTVPVGKANTGNTTTEAARTELVSEYFILTVDIDTHQNNGALMSLYILKLIHHVVGSKGAQPHRSH